MKSLFRKHYERKKRNNVAIKHPVSQTENEIDESVKKKYAELDYAPCIGNTVHEDVLQTGSLHTLNESVMTQNDDCSNVLKQVADCRNYRQMQPDVATTEHSVVSVAGSSRATAEGHSHTKEDGTLNNRSVSHCHSSQTQSLTVLNESVGSQKPGSSNVLRRTSNLQQDNRQVSNSKTFPRTQFKSEDITHWKPQQDGEELRISNNIKCQRTQNAGPGRSFAVVPKKVRIWDGE
jgi:hypothetical protein